MLQHLPCVCNVKQILTRFTCQNILEVKGGGGGEQLRLRECVQEGGMGGKRLAGVDYG